MGSSQSLARSEMILSHFGSLTIDLRNERVGNVHALEKVTMYLAKMAGLCGFGPRFCVQSYAEASSVPIHLWCTFHGGLSDNVI
jgi:hypothetical protein